MKCVLTTSSEVVGEASAGELVGSGASLFSMGEEVCPREKAATWGRHTKQGLDVCLRYRQAASHGWKAVTEKKRVLTEKERAVSLQNGFSSLTAFCGQRGRTVWRGVSTVFCCCANTQEKLFKGKNIYLPPRSQSRAGNHSGRM